MVLRRQLKRLVLLPVELPVHETRPGAVAPLAFDGADNGNRTRQHPVDSRAALLERVSAWWYTATACLYDWH